MANFKNRINAIADILRQVAIINLTVIITDMFW